MPLQATSGAASYDAFGGGLAAIPVYIEDVFSTWLYTGNGSTQTITNGIDLAGKGGLVWQKMRSDVASHLLTDTARGSGYALVSNSTGAQFYNSSIVSSFNSNGFTDGGSQASGATYASWTFREQPKFFDVVTYTGDGTDGRQITHSLGSVPGCIIVKRTDNTGSWPVWHRSSAFQNARLNTTASVTGGGLYVYGDTSTTFQVSNAGGGADSDAYANINGATYVAYLFAHNAGGFGLTGTDNVISCGSYTGNGSTQDINLGYEAQWVLVKNATTAGWDWYTIDNMRGFVVNPASPSFTKSLSPNTSGAESDQTAISPSSTGFRLNSGAGAFNQSGQTYIYIAIRRGPMRTPTTGTSVFVPVTTTNDMAATTTGFPVDLVMESARAGSAFNAWTASRLQGMVYMSTSATSAEASVGIVNPFASNTSVTTRAFGSGASAILWNLRRAPGFFDVVCYTGTGSARTLAHNLGVAPEMMIVKRRNADGDWATYTVTTGVSHYIRVNETSASAFTANLLWNSTAPTSTVFSLGTDGWVNGSGATYVAYLFASVPGVSKVGSYTGTGTTQTINCGFTAGSRFVMIKRTDSTGDWYVWDSARGIVAGNDPYLLLNSTAAEVTNTDFVDTAATGFEISSTAPAAINASGGTFIFLAIA